MIKRSEADTSCKFLLNYVGYGRHICAEYAFEAMISSKNTKPANFKLNLPFRGFMNTEQQLLIQLLKIGAEGQSTDMPSPVSADWDNLFAMAAQQGVTCLAFSALEALQENDVTNCPTEVKLNWFVQSQYVVKETKRLFETSADFAEKTKPFNIVALKGVDYARFWPNPYWREFTDLDIVAIDDRAKICSNELDVYARGIGYKVEDGGYKHSHIHYRRMMIENHHFFTSFAGTGKGHLLEKELHKLFADSDFNKINETALLSPNASFTAVFMIAHAQNHFFYEGIALRHVLDWHFFLQKEYSNVDWERVCDIYERTGLKTFVELITVFCIKNFGLQLQVPLIDTEKTDSKLLDAFTKDVFSEKYDSHDRRWWMMIKRMIHRYKRMWKFRELMNTPIHKAIWRTIAYSSFLHRKPELK